MFEKKVLDKGFVRLLNISGAIRRPTDLESNFVSERERNFDAIDTDPAIVARSSYNKRDQEHTQEQDERLSEYLIRNEHITPLEFTTVILEFKMPIFVARQVVRHRTGNLADNNTGNEPAVNEVSGRYVTLPKDWYIPEVVRGKHSGGNKQGSEDNLSKEVQDAFKVQLQESCENSYWYYENALEVGVCPEQARMFLHLNHYTQFVWKQDLHNLMHFLSLRLDEHAQWEVRQYAEAIYELLKEHLPRSMEWFVKYRRKLDKTEQDLLLDTIAMMNQLDLPEDKIRLLEKLAGRNGLKI
jgi:thymidylate synthase (FAD)